MKLIVGLGNPGKEYDKTRHNVGFMVMDRLADVLNVSIDMKKFKGEYAKLKYQGEDVILLKPMTYMNNSGESVIQVMNYFKIDVDDLLVIYDDMDMPVGKLRLRESGSAGGHNGVKSLIAHVGTQSFKRIRVGIDKHPHIKVIDYVLGKFTKDEQPLIDEGIENAVKAVEVFLQKDFVAAMNGFN
ncbi:aminoacyl-tRNA hydrolase [Candidatus Stoquefichus sp. SB1]|jgi:PTH1 family peptidyl-tRNA hydrolase|uniref:aminoacyl-tRNA hydrolase n=1 Tax=Candidatus Stoquefichus sp. SB1 TaxID=1658109 RepID=UPI00067ED0B7|nr:aminoacyl-tRNA hydrolase [Candidatus Stoquefichus sp. SB1]